MKKMILFIKYEVKIIAHSLIFLLQFFQMHNLLLQAIPYLEGTHILPAKQLPSLYMQSPASRTPKEVLEEGHLVVIIHRL